MKYKLIHNNDAFLIDKTPILQDVKDTYIVSFVLPTNIQNCGYIALLKGIDGIEYRKSITDSQLKIPKELIKKEQYIELTVCQINDEEILQTWQCAPLKVTAFLHLRKTQFELSTGLTNADYIAKVEQLNIEMTQLKIQTQNKLIQLQEQFNSSLSQQQNDAVVNYNKLVGVINGLSEELEDLKSNYDPILERRR